MIFAIKKAKTAKNVLNKRAFAAVQAEKQKYVYTTGLTSCEHSYPHVTIFKNGKVKIDM